MSDESGRERATGATGAAGESGGSDHDASGSTDDAPESERDDGAARAPWGTLHDLGETVSDIVEGAFRTVSPAGGRYPRYDLVRIPDLGFRVSIDLPGLEKGEVDLSVVRGELQIGGRRERPELPEGATVERSERPYGRFRRTLRIPAGVDASGIRARMTNGVLEIDLPFAGESEEQKIEVT